MSSQRDNAPNPPPGDEKVDINRHSSGTSVTSSYAVKAQPSTPPANASQTLKPEPVETAITIGKLDEKNAGKKGKKDKKDQNDQTDREDPFKHLPEHEATVLRRQVETPDVNVGYWGLFAYASKKDWAIFAVSVFCAIVAGVAMPLMTVSSGGEAKPV
jgi:hypothetical protein